MVKEYEQRAVREREKRAEKRGQEGWERESEGNGRWR